MTFVNFTQAGPERHSTDGHHLVEKLALSGQEAALSQYHPTSLHKGLSSLHEGLLSTRTCCKETSRTGITHRMGWGVMGQKVEVSLGPLPKPVFMIPPPPPETSTVQTIPCPPFSKRDLPPNLCSRETNITASFPLATCEVFCLLPASVPTSAPPRASPPPTLDTEFFLFYLNL